MNPKLRQHLFFWARIAIALVFIAIIVLTVDLKKTWEELKGTNPIYISLSVLLYAVFIGFLALRWLILSKARNHPYGFLYLYRSLAIHFLFNNVLPTTIGGDVYRIMDTGGHEGKGVSFSIVWTDRMMGFIGVFSFAFLASIFYFFASKSYVLLIVFGAAFVFAVGVTTAFLSKKINDWLSTWLPKVKVFKYPVGQKITSAFKSITEFQDHKTSLFLSVLVSLVIQVCLAGIWYLLFLSLGGKTSFLHIMVTIPVVNTLAMFSVGGWGLREQTFVQMLATFAVAKSTALATSVLFDVVNVFFGITGGIFLLLRRKQTSLGKTSTPQN